MSNTVQKLEELGWVEYKDIFSGNSLTRCKSFYKRFQSKESCRCNGDKPGIQVVLKFFPTSRFHRSYGIGSYRRNRRWNLDQNPELCTPKRLKQNSRIGGKTCSNLGFFGHKMKNKIKRILLWLFVPRLAIIPGKGAMDSIYRFNWEPLPKGYRWF